MGAGVPEDCSEEGLPTAYSCCCDCPSLREELWGVVRFLAGLLFVLPRAPRPMPLVRGGLQCCCSRSAGRSAERGRRVCAPPASSSPCWCCQWREQRVCGPSASASARVGWCPACARPPCVEFQAPCARIPCRRSVPARGARRLRWPARARASHAPAHEARPHRPPAPPAWRALPQVRAWPRRRVPVPMLPRVSRAARGRVTQAATHSWPRLPRTMRRSSRVRKVASMPCLLSDGGYRACSAPPWGCLFRCLCLPRPPRWRES